VDLGGTVARAAGETLGDQGGGTRSCVAAGGVRLGELDGRCTCRHRKGRTVDQLVSVTVPYAEVQKYGSLTCWDHSVENWKHIFLSFFFVILNGYIFFQFSIFQMSDEFLLLFAFG
jgi:hypothetical protein